MIEIIPLASIDPAAVDTLLDRAFGKDRHRRTAYAIRGAARALTQLSFAAVSGDTLVGSVQCWPVVLADDDGGEHPMVMVGPVAVAPELQRDGIGRTLMQHALDAADAQASLVGEGLMLIGDPEYYARFFGFSAARTAQWRVPGPVERHRLLARGPHVPDVAGLLGPAVALAA